MRKLIMFNLITLDGFFEGPNHEIDWHNVDHEFNDYAIQQIHSVDTILFGRVTYQMMVSYWPTPQAIRDDPIVADLMNKTPKIVFSNTLRKVDWQNTTLVRGNAADAVGKLKLQSGREMIIFGSGKLVSALTSPQLIDEYRFIVNPVVLGSGIPMFNGLKDRLHLKLVNSRVFRNGNVLLCYQPVGRK